MVNQPKSSIEGQRNSINTKEKREIPSQIDEKILLELIESFGSEKESRRSTISKILKENNIRLPQLKGIKIDINHIESCVHNKPDIPKELEKGIAKLYLKELFKNGFKNYGFLKELRTRFQINKETDIDNIDIDFKALQVFFGKIGKVGNQFKEIIAKTIITNEEIFKLLENEINENLNFEGQNPSTQDTILDLLQFELKGTFYHSKLLGESTEKDAISAIRPTQTIPEMFDRVKNSKIIELNLQRSRIEDFLHLEKEEFTTQKSAILQEYLQSLEDGGLAKEKIQRIRDLLIKDSDYNTIKKYLEEILESINKEIWETYINNLEKSGENKELIQTLQKLCSNKFNFSALDKKEQTLLWQILIVNKIDKKENSWMKCMGLDQEEYKTFLKDLYDFEKDNLHIDIYKVGNLNLKIQRSINKRKDREGNEHDTYENFVDIENFKNMDKINPVKFTVNIDDNDEELIKNIEETSDSPLRTNGIMETFISKGKQINIGNGYKLDICGKTINKSQINELLDCNSDEDKLNKKLKEFGLYDELKDLVISTKNEIFNPQNVYYDFDENGVALNNDNGYGPYGERSCIFKEMLKKIDVKVVERNLIFEGEDIDKLSLLYILAKNQSPRNAETLGPKKDEKIDRIFHRSDNLNESSDTAGESLAEQAFEMILNNYNDFYENVDEGSPEDDDYIIQEDTRNFIENGWDNLNEEQKKGFEQRLQDLKNDNYDINDKLSNEIDELIDDLKHRVDDDNNETENTEETEDNTENEKTEEEKVQELWKSFAGDPDVAFEKGSRLYVDLGNSQLPPIHKADSQKSYYCFEIDSITDTTFTLKAIGGDFGDNLDGKIYELPKTEEQLQHMKSEGGKIFKVRNRKESGWDYSMESINKAGFFEKFTAFGDMKDQVKLKGDKFVKKVINNGKEEEVEVKYFNNLELSFDDSDKDVSKRGQGDSICKYEIKKVNTNKGTVTLSSTFDTHDEDYEDIKYKYECEIPFEQFILLMEGKRLKGYSEAEEKQLETKHSISDPGRQASKCKRNRVSIGSVINVFQNLKKTIKGKLDERVKDQEDILDNYIYSQEGLNLYGRLKPFLGDSAEKLQYEFYTNRENRTWKKIDEWYKIFSADPNYPELFNEHLKDLLSKGGRHLEDKERYKFAAAFLLMVKKEGPYPRVFTQYKDKGIWIEKLLGPEHKQRFLDDFYKKKKATLEQEKDMGNQSGVRLAMQEELNKMEIQYIISVIDGRSPYGGQSNEFMLKSIRGTKFFGELEANLGEYYNKHEEEKGKMETFFAAEEQYLRTVAAGRFNKALPALERMCETAKTKGEVFRIKGYMMSAMLMGIIKNNSTAKTIKSFWGTCRSMGFTPGFWMRDIEQQEKVKILLDGITNGKFSEDTKFNMADFEPGELKDGKYLFVRKFEGYRKSHGEDILAKIENPSYKKNDDDKSIMDLAREKDNPNNHVFKSIIKNSTTNDIDKTNDNVPPIFAQESPLTAINDTITRGYYIPSNGNYGPKDPEKISDCEDFRKNVNTCLSNCNSNKDTTEFLFKKYFNRFESKFSSNEKKTIVRSIKTIQEQKSLGNIEDAKFMIRYMFKGILHDTTHGSFPADFDNVMNKFTDYFFKNIELIDEGIIRSTFDEKEVIDSFNNPFIMLNWSQFMTYNMKETKGTISQGKGKYNTLISLKKLDDGDIINRKIDHIWSSIHNKCTVPKLLTKNNFGECVDVTIDKKTLAEMKEKAEKEIIEE